MKRWLKFSLAGMVSLGLIAGGTAIAVAATQGTPPGPSASLLETALLGQLDCTNPDNAACFNEPDANDVNCTSEGYTAWQWEFDQGDFEDEVICNVYDDQGNYVADIFVYPHPGTPANEATGLIGNPPWMSGMQYRYTDTWESVTTGYNEYCKCFPNGTQPDDPTYQYAYGPPYGPN